MKGIIRNNPVSHRLLRSRLLGAGLIQETQSAQAPRCELYRQYFWEPL
jgi:hypothetical protein